MSRTKRAGLNVLAAALHMIVNQLISLTVSIKVLESYGPDFHGLNSVLSNMMTWILLLESGLTTASTVALYKPYMKKEYERCNQILSASRQKYQEIGGLMFLAGAGVALVYPFFLKTEIPYWDICLIFMIMTCSTSFGVFFTRKYSIMYSVTQNEYVSQLVNIATSIAGNAVVYVLAVTKANYIWIRTAYLLVTIATGLILAAIIKRKYRFINYKEKPDHQAIRGTKDVVAQKLTSVIRNALPSLYISTAIGTTAASVYAVTLYGYNFIRSIVTNVLNATQSGMGQLVADKNTEEVYGVFRIFEYIVTAILIWLMSSAVMVTIPFINYYTRNVPDVDYVNYFLWLIIPLNISIQMLHIPSGVMINMHARFREDRNFQLISIGVMISTMLIAGQLWGLEGIMLGVTAGSLALAVQEIRYARKKIFCLGYGDLFKPVMINLAVLIPAMMLEYRLIPQKVTIIQFLLCGMAVAAVHGVLMFAVNFIFERERLILSYRRVQQLFRRKRRK